MASHDEEPHFFKIILTETLQDRKLRIPRMFARKYGEALSDQDQVVLKLPSGIEWKMELKIIDRNFWLTKGWHQFAEYCRVEEGHLMVFRYLGNSSFYTLIFDKSATEIKYPCKFIKKETEIFEDSKANGSNFPRSKRPRENSATPRCDIQPQKKTKTGKPCNPGSQNIHHGQNVAKKKVSMREPRNQIVGPEKVKALQRACGFKSQNPFFTVVMNPSRMNKNMYVPIKFVREHLEKKIDKVTVTVSDGRMWPLECYWCLIRNPGHKLMFNGWKTVAQANHLKVGDVCVFELIEKDRILFNLIIFPSQGKKIVANKVKLESPTEMCPRPKALANERASSSTSENPKFSITMNQSYVSASRLNVPGKFFRRYLEASYKENDRVMLRTSHERLWYAKFIARKRNSQKRRYNGTRYEIGKGWSRFRVENNLRVGDVCVFELVKVGKASSFNVVISRATEDSNPRVVS